MRSKQHRPPSPYTHENPSTINTAAVWCPCICPLQIKPSVLFIKTWRNFCYHDRLHSEWQQCTATEAKSKKKRKKNQKSFEVKRSTKGRNSKTKSKPSPGKEQSWYHLKKNKNIQLISSHWPRTVAESGPRGHLQRPPTLIEHQSLRFNQVKGTTFV